MAVTPASVSIAEVRRAHRDLISAEQAGMAGNMDGAQQICQDLLERHPDYAGALQVLAITYIQRGAYVQALPLLVRAMMLNPRDWAVLTNAGRVFLNLDAPECAIRYLEKSLALKPDEHSTLFVLGRALMVIQHHERASEVLERIYAVEPGEPAAPFWLCECYLHLRRYDDAARIFIQALKTPLNRDVKAYAYSLASLFPENIKLDLDILDSLDTLRGPQSGDEAATQSSIAFTRGACLERLNRHKDAWDCLVAANAPLQKEYMEQARTHAEQAEELLSICLNWNPRKKKPAKEAGKVPLSLFIIGLSRSGLNSMQSLVRALPCGEILHEHDLATATAQYISQREGLLTAFHLCRLPRELDPVIAKSYRARLLRCAGGSDIVTVTHPGAIFDAGRLVDCAPNVKFIFMRRNDDEVAFRIFGQLYHANTNQYAYDLNAIYNHISNNNILIDNWLEKLGNQAIAIQYEDMVDDPGSTLARIAKFCGLKTPPKPGWSIADDRGCAEPYRKWIQAERDRL